MKKFAFKEEVDAAMQQIFKKNKVRSGQGEEMFWQAVDRVKKKSAADARKLKSLADVWQKLPYKDSFPKEMQNVKFVNLDEDDIRLIKEPILADNGAMLIGSSCDDSAGVGAIILLDVADIIEMGRNDEFGYDDTLFVRVKSTEKDADEPIETYYLYDFVIIAKHEISKK